VSRDLPLALDGEERRYRLTRALPRACDLALLSGFSDAVDTGLSPCRRRDSNPRHADYDSRASTMNWLQLAGFPPRYRPYFSLEVAR
jgi:hypothetical protein